nr:MAG TPA: hypothetical protein [Caudoviricetes sp.]
MFFRGWISHKRFNQVRWLLRVMRNKMYLHFLHNCYIIFTTN